MLYYQTKFHVSPHCDLDIENSEPIFLHDTLAYDAT